MEQGAELFGTTYRRGEVVFRQGEAGDAMYIIQSGAVEVSQRKNGRESVIAILEKSDFFGEMALLQNIDPSDIKTTPVNSNESGKGIGVVEAPRGVLIHSYTVNRGRIERLKLLVATQFNNPLINLIIKDLAESHLEHGSLSENGQEAIGRCVRLFDPCLTCATH